MIKRVVGVVLALTIAAFGFSTSAMAVESVNDGTVITDPHCSPTNYWLVDEPGHLYKGEDIKPFMINDETVNVQYQSLWNTDIAASDDKVYVLYGNPLITKIDTPQLIRTLDLHTGKFKNVRFKLPSKDAQGNVINYPQNGILPNALSLLPDGSLMFGIWNMSYIFSLQKFDVDKADADTIVYATAVSKNINSAMRNAGIGGSSGDFAPDPNNPDGLFS